MNRTSAAMKPQSPWWKRFRRRSRAYYRQLALRSLAVAATLLIGAAAIYVMVNPNTGAHSGAGPKSPPTNPSSTAHSGEPAAGGAEPAAGGPAADRSKSPTTSTAPRGGGPTPSARPAPSTAARTSRSSHPTPTPTSRSSALSSSHRPKPSPSGSSAGLLPTLDISLPCIPLPLLPCD